MKRNAKRALLTGLLLTALFALWTFLIQTVDVRPVGQNGTDIGFAALNVWFHELTDVHMWIYTITDWLGLVPIAVCMVFAVLGFVQLVKRRNLFRVDRDILLLGVYYLLVIFGYLIFEMIPINYRPVLIASFLEASYPSSTTLLVLSVMPTLSFEAHRRLRSKPLLYAADGFVTGFSLFMVIGRTVAGVHWLTDILGSVLLSGGLYLLWRGSVLLTDEKQQKTEEATWNSTKNCRSCAKTAD